MIKRYSITLTKPRLSKEFQATIDGDFKPAYNAGPGQKLPVITSDNPHRIHLFQWGILPFNSSDSGIADKLINARAKTLFAKEPFCNLVKSKRCVIPADGFYAWKEQYNVSVPYRVTSELGNVFCIAGVWEEWRMDDNSESMFGSFTMITRESREEIKEFSERMPLILNEEEKQIWLNETIEENFISELLNNPQGLKMKVAKVTNLVNDLKNNTRKVIKEVNAPLPGDTLSLF